MIIYTIGTESLSTKAHSNPNGTVTAHIVMVSHIKPNLLSPPAQNIPDMVAIFKDFPTT